MAIWPSSHSASSGRGQGPWTVWLSLLGLVEGALTMANLLFQAQKQKLSLKPLRQGSLQNLLSQRPLRRPGAATAEQGCGTAAVGLHHTALACIWQCPTPNPGCDSSRDDKNQPLSALCVCLTSSCPKAHSPSHGSRQELILLAYFLLFNPGKTDLLSANLAAWDCAFHL